MRTQAGFDRPAIEGSRERAEYATGFRFLRGFALSGRRSSLFHQHGVLDEIHTRGQACCALQINSGIAAQSKRVRNYDRDTKTAVVSVERYLRLWKIQCAVIETRAVASQCGPAP